VKVRLSISNPEHIEHDGDPLERHFAAKILQTIPSYAMTWEKYIGNDGSAQALPIFKPTHFAEQNRAKFWERAYTLFESLSLCWKLEEEFNHREKIKSCEDYMSNLNAWIAFYAHLGRIYDMAKDISDQLNGKVSVSPIKEFSIGVV